MAQIADTGADPAHRRDGTSEAAVKMIKKVKAPVRRRCHRQQHRRGISILRECPGPGLLNADAIIAQWKIGGDADLAVADLEEVIETSPYGTAKAMETLAAIDQPMPDPLRPMLRYFAWWPDGIGRMH